MRRMSRKMGRRMIEKGFIFHLKILVYIKISKLFHYLPYRQLAIGNHNC